MEEIKELLISIRDNLILIKEEQERANDLKEVELGIKFASEYDADRLSLKEKKRNEQYNSHNRANSRR